MKRFGILTLQYYRLLLLYNIACSIMAVFIIMFGAGPLNAGSLLYAKLIGFAAAAGLQYYASKNTYFYFRNAGYRVRHIIISAFTLEILVYILLLIIYIKIK